MTQEEQRKEKVKKYVHALERLDRDIKELDEIKDNIGSLRLNSLVSTYNGICLSQARDKIIDAISELQEVSYHLKKGR